MQKQPSALLVYGRPGPLDTLSEAVNERLFQTTRVRTCAEARRKFQTANSPHVVFSDTRLPDGLWSDVLRVVADAVFGLERVLCTVSKILEHPVEASEGATANVLSSQIQSETQKGGNC